MTSRRWFLGGLGAGLLLARAARAQSMAYTYDLFGRVTTVTYPNGTTTTYTYDAADNRSQRTTSATPPPPPPPPPTVALSGTFWSSGPGYGDPPITATASGGTAPYAYLWQKVSGVGGFSATAGTTRTTAWQYNGGDPVKPITTQWRCRVTDAVQAVGYSGEVAVSYSPF